MSTQANFPSFDNPISLPGSSSFATGLNSYQQHFFDVKETISSRPLWEMEEYEICPLTGLCLPEQEAKKILKKAGLSVKKLSEMETHKVLKYHLTDKNNVSQKVDRHLKKKYQSAIDTYFEMPEKEFLKKWKEQLNSGKFDDLFYIALCRVDLSKDTILSICGDQHMSAYNQNHKLETLHKELDMTKDCLLDVSSQLKKRKQLCRDQSKEISQLKSENEEQALKLKIFETTDITSVQQELESTREENRRLLQKMEELKKTNKQLESRLGKVESKYEKNRAQLIKMDELSQELRQEIEQMHSVEKPLNPCMEDPNKECNPANCNKTVLVVGGITKIKHLYRDLIEKNGGTFEYHDGHIKGGWLNLENKVCKSDVVLCPVNCNSHGACLKVKELCKKYNKPIQMLPTSSISGISNALNYN